MEKNIGKTLQKLRLEAGYQSVKEFASRYGFSYATYRRWELGEREPNSDDLIIIAGVHNVTVDQILGLADLSKRNLKAIRIPVLGRIPAGVPIDAIEDILDWEELDPQQFNPDHEYFGLVVRGDSMYPEYLDGDIIIVQQTEDADSGKDVVAYVNGYEATLKRLYRYENGSIELRPINPNYESKKFSIEEVKAEPVVIRGIVKELRRKK